MKTGVKTHKKRQPKKTNNSRIQQTVKKQPQKSKKDIKKRRRIVAASILIILLLWIFVAILLSDLFNIKQIIVINNSKVSAEEILKISELSTNDNMFKVLKTKIKAKIKTNPYIEDVKITKKLNGQIILDVEERMPTYMLIRESEYIYINNQGYILEVSQIPLQLPIIKGYKTQELLLGARMEREDLQKLDTVIQIMETAKSNGIKDIIAAIDISDKRNFILEIPSESKTVEFGDETNINIKILWIVDLIDKEKEVAGEIILNVPNIKKVYFREKV